LLFEREKTNKEKWSKIYETDNIVRKIRATMTEPNEKAIVAMCGNFNIYPDNQIVNASITTVLTLQEYNSDNDKNRIEVDFQDMIELCVKNKEIRVPQYDYVFIDEAQDCSRLDQLFIERLLKQRGRLITVGDNRQAIYSFRGADIRSFEYFANRPNTIKLPLTVSYRCSKKIVEHAKNVYPEIEPWEQSEEGIVRMGKIDEVRNGDMVLCRNVRPLVEVFFMLLDLGKKATIVGKDLEKGLLTVLNDVDSNIQTTQLPDILKNKLQKKGNDLVRVGYGNFESHPKYVSLQEKIEVILTIARQCETIRETEQMIENIFHDQSVAPIKLMTIHKAKGLECNRVFVIEKFEGKKLIPSQYAITKDQLTQEQNLKFVAYTRAKKELVKVNL